MPIPKPSELMNSPYWADADEELRASAVDKWRQDVYADLWDKRDKIAGGVNNSNFQEIEDGIGKTFGDVYAEKGIYDRMLEGAFRMEEMGEGIVIANKNKSLNTAQQNLDRYKQEADQDEITEEQTGERIFRPLDNPDSKLPLESRNKIISQLEERMIQEGKDLQDETVGFMANQVLAEQHRLAKGNTRAEAMWNALPADPKAITDFLTSGDGKNWAIGTMIQQLPQSSVQILAGLANPAAAGVIGGLAEFGGGLIERVQRHAVENGLDADNPAVLAAIMSDKTVMAEINQKAGIKAGVIGVVDALGMGISTAIAKKIASASAKVATPAMIAAGEAIVADPFFGGAGEALGDLASGDPISSKGVTEEAVAGFGTTAVVGGATAYGEVRQNIKSRDKLADALSENAVTNKRRGEISTFGIDDPIDPGKNFMGKKFKVDQEGSSMTYDEIKHLGLNPENLTSYEKAALVDNFERVTILPDGSVHVDAIVDSGPSFGTKRIDFLPASITRMNPEATFTRKDGKIVGIEGLDIGDTYIASKGVFEPMSSEQSAVLEARERIEMARNSQLDYDVKTADESPASNVSEADFFGPETEVNNETNNNNNRVDDEIDSIAVDIVRRNRLDYSINIPEEISRLEAIANDPSPSVSVEAKEQALDKLSDLILLDNISPGRLQSIQAAEFGRDTRLETLEDLSGKIEDAVKAKQKERNDRGLENAKMLKERNKEDRVNLAEIDKEIKNLADNIGKMFMTGDTPSGSEPKALAADVERIATEAFAAHLNEITPEEFKTLIQVANKIPQPPAAFNQVNRQSILDAVKSAFPDKNESFIHRAVNAIIQTLKKIKDSIVRQFKDESGGIFVTDIGDFRRRMKGSKVVDENGNPKVVYHATLRSFKTFIRATGDIGFHFGTIAQAEDRIAVEDDDMNSGFPEGSNVYPAYLDIKNPLRLRDAEDWTEFRNVFIALQASKQFPDSFLDEIQSKVARLSDPAANRVVREELQKKGFDGIVYLNRHENRGEADNVTQSFATLSDENFSRRVKHSEDSWIAFDDDQIINATGINPLGEKSSANTSQSDQAEKAEQKYEFISETQNEMIGDVQTLLKQLMDEGPGFTQEMINKLPQALVSYYADLPSTTDSPFAKGVLTRLYDYGELVHKALINHGDEVRYGKYDALRGSTIPEFLENLRDISIKAEQARRDTDYLKDVKNGDVEAQKKINDQVAKENGLSEDTYYHGSPVEGITEFNGLTNWFTKDKRFAAEYAIRRGLEVGKLEGESIYGVKIKDGPAINVRRAGIERNSREFAVEILMQAKADGLITTEQISGNKDLKAKLDSLDKTETKSVWKIWDSDKDFIDFVKVLGYEKIITTEGGVETVGVFNSSNIKSAEPVIKVGDRVILPSERFDDSSDIRGEVAKQLEQSLPKNIKDHLNEAGLPEWVRQEMQDRGYSPDKMGLLLVDVDQRHIREAVMSDPTLSEEEKANVIGTGSKNAPREGTEAAKKVETAKKWIEGFKNESGSTVIFGEIANAIIDGAKSAAELVSRLAAKGYEISKDIAQAILDHLKRSFKDESGAVINPRYKNPAGLSPAARARAGLSPTSTTASAQKGSQPQPGIVPPLVYGDNLYKRAMTLTGIAGHFVFKGLGQASERIGKINKKLGVASNFVLQTIDGRTLTNSQDSVYVASLIIGQNQDAVHSQGAVLRTRLEPLRKEVAKVFGHNIKSGKFELIKNANPDKSHYPSDVLTAIQEDPSNYNLSPSQRQTADRLIKAQRELTEWAIATGNNVDPKTGEVLFFGNEPYFTRGFPIDTRGNLVTGQQEAALAAQKNKGIKKTKRTFNQNSRGFVTEEDGVEAGLHYLSPTDRLIEYYTQLGLQIGNKAFAEVATASKRVTKAEIKADVTAEVDAQIADGTLKPKRRGVAIKAGMSSRLAALTSTDIIPGETYYLPPELAAKLIKQQSYFANPSGFKKINRAIRSSASIAFAADVGWFGLQFSNFGALHPITGARAAMVGLMAFFQEPGAAIKASQKNPELKEIVDDLNEGGYKQGEIMEDTRPKELKHINPAGDFVHENKGLTTGIEDTITKAKDISILIPGLKLNKFDRAFSATLDYAAFILANARKKSDKRKGIDVTSISYKKELADTYTRMTGRGNTIAKTRFDELGDAQAMAESVGFFAPGYYRGGSENIILGLTQIGGMESEAAREALLSSYLAGAMLTAAALFAAGVRDPDEWVDRILNPFSKNWLRADWKVNGHLNATVSYGNIHKPMMQTVLTMFDGDQDKSLKDEVVKFIGNRKSVPLSTYFKLMDPEGGGFKKIGTGTAAHYAYITVSPVIPVMMQGMIEDSSTMKKAFGLPLSTIEAEEAYNAPTARLVDVGLNAIGVNSFIPGLSSQQKINIKREAFDRYGMSYADLSPNQRVALTNEIAPATKDELGQGGSWNGYTEKYVYSREKYLDPKAREFYAKELGWREDLMFPRSPKVYNISKKGTEHMLMDDEHKKAVKLFAFHLNEQAKHSKYELPKGMTAGKYKKLIIKEAERRTVSNLGYKTK